MATPDERLARLEQAVNDLAGDVRESSDESKRTRQRLHDLEGTTGMLVEQEKFRREATAYRQKRMERRVSLLAVVVSVAALVEPFLYHLANGG